MEIKDYCKKCDTGRQTKNTNVRCSSCGKMFVSNHKPLDTVCPECTEYLKSCNIYNCRSCGEPIDSAVSASEESVVEGKDMSRAYRRKAAKEKKNRGMKINSYANNGTKSKNGKYIIDNDVDVYERGIKASKKRSNRHSDKNVLKRGLREGFTYDDLDDMTNGVQKFSGKKY